MTQDYADHSEYYVIDQSLGQPRTLACKTRQEAKAILEVRITQGSKPGNLLVIHGEKQEFHYQRNVLVTFEDERTDP